jgi:hypothetical protein
MGTNQRREEVKLMKGLILIGAMIALFVAVPPLVPQKAYAADTGYIELLVPAESQEAELGGGETPFVPMEPVVLGNDTGFIERLLPAESQEVETGGGETSPMGWVPIAPVEFGHDAGYIERLLPSD